MAGFSVENSKLYLDIQDIVKNHKEPFVPVFSFETKLHTVDKDLSYQDGVVLTDIYMIRNYVENISDYIEVKLSVPPGVFIYDVYDYLNNIEVTLITTKQSRKNKKPLTITERYKAIYLLEKNKAIPNIANYNKHDLNNQMPFIIVLQLLNRSAETIRVKTTQGNFDKAINKNKDMSIETFFKSVISEQVNKILIENKPAIESFNIEPPDNKDKLKSVTIPSFTRIVELPELIQEKNIGVYNGGIGMYIQKFGSDYHTYKNSMFIYSLYNCKKFKESEYKIMFYVPITSSHSIGGHTYKYEDKVLKILPYNITRFEDNKESAVMSTGSGFRVSNANSYMKKPVEITPDGPVFKKDSLSTEVVFKQRDDGLNFAPNKNVTGNQFKLTSNLLHKNGVYITVEVSNIDHDFIYPGAKCKILHETKDGSIKETYGVIHGAIITYSNNNPNVVLTHNTPKINLTSHMSLQVFSERDN